MRGGMCGAVDSAYSGMSAAFFMSTGWSGDAALDEGDDGPGAGAVAAGLVGARAPDVAGPGTEGTMNDEAKSIIGAATAKGIYDKIDDATPDPEPTR